MTTTMVSPFEGRVTSNWRGYPGHKGKDIAPPKPGQLGLPVYAAFNGYVERVASGVKHGNTISTWAKGRTGNGALVKNVGPGTSNDGEGQGYNHTRMIVKEGDFVQAGQIIGYNDSSGTQSGPHLHFEMWGNWKDHDSDYDPDYCFRKYGVKAGSAPALVLVPVTSVTPISKPGAKPTVVKPAVKGDPKVLTYQKRQRYYPNMLPDGIDGKMNKAHKAWAKKLVKAMSKWKASIKLGKLKADGDYGNLTYKHVYAIKRGNWALYKKHGGKHLNGLADAAFCKMLKISNHPAA